MPLKIQKPSAFRSSVLVSFIVIFGVACAVAYHDYNDTINYAVHSIETRANLLAKIILERQRAAIGVIRSYGSRPLLVDSVKKKDFEEAVSHLTSLVEDNPEIGIAFITDSGGTLWANFPFLRKRSIKIFLTKIGIRV